MPNAALARLLTSDLRPLTSALLLRSACGGRGVRRGGRGEGDLDAAVARAARGRRVGRDGVRSAHAVGLYARAVNARGDEAARERLGPVLRQLPQGRFVAARVCVSLYAEAQVPIGRANV